MIDKDDLAQTTTDFIHNVAAPIQNTLLTAYQPGQPISPVVWLAVSLSFCFGGLKTWTDRQERRMAEVTTYVEPEKMFQMMQEDKRSDVLHKILVEVLDESAEYKRKMYYQYVNNLYNDVHPEFDNHSKINYTINNISPDELYILFTLRDKRDEIATETKKYRGNSGDLNYFLSMGESLEYLLKVSYFNRFNEESLEVLLTSLSNYNLIFIKNGTWDGPFYGRPTAFGKVFCDYVDGYNSSRE